MPSAATKTMTKRRIIFPRQRLTKEELTTNVDAGVVAHPPRAPCVQTVVNPAVGVLSLPVLGQAVECLPPHLLAAGSHC